MSIKTIATGKVFAAGVLFYAQNTGNFLTIYRSKDVVDGSCWCGAGGKIEPGETPEQAARREVVEEIGFNTYENDGTYVDLYVHDSDTLKFYNFLGIVDEQFFPRLNWESDGYVWTPLSNVPQPHHYGLDAILNDPHAMSIIRRAQQGQL